jgi:hypothetical protein
MKFDLNPLGVRRRLLSPRIFIYVIIALAMAWLMHRYDKAQQLGATQRPNVSQEIRLTNPELAGLPMIVVIPQPGQDIDAEIAEAQRKLQGVAHVTMLNAVNGDEIKKLFKLNALPAAILYDAKNAEVTRREGDITADALEALVR